MTKHHGSTPWTGPEKTKEVPLTSLERFVSLEILSMRAPKNFDAVRRGRDLYDVLLAAGTAYAWDWDDVASRPLDPKSFEEIHNLVFTRATLRTLADVIKSDSGDLPGRKAFVLLELFERAEYILQDSGS